MLIILVVLCIVSVIHLLFRLASKIKAVTTPNEAAPWNETYCIFHLYNLRLVRIVCYVLLFRLSILLGQFVLGDKWYIYFFPKSMQRDCFECMATEPEMPMYVADSAL